MVQFEQEEVGAAHLTFMPHTPAYVNPSLSTLNDTGNLSAFALQFRTSELNEHDLDTAVREVIDAYRDGRCTEGEARQVIAVAVVGSKVVSSTAAKQGVDASSTEEMLDRVRIRMTEKILDSDATYYDFEKAVEGSTSGWARKSVSNLCLQYIRDMGRANTRFGTVEPMSGMEETGHTHEGLVSYDDPSSESVEQIDHKRQHIDDFEEARRTLRGAPLVRYTVNCAISMFQVTRPVRPRDYDDREYVRKAIAADDALAYRSLETFGAIVYGIDDDDDAVTRRAVDDRILGLWDDFTHEQVERLLDAAPLFAHALALDAVSPLPRPSAKAIQRMRASVARLKKNDHRWRSIAISLVDSWVATEFDAVAEYAVVSVETREKMRQGRVLSVAKWPLIAQTVIEYPGQPLGDSVDEIRATLETLATQHFVTSGKMLPGLDGVFNEAI